MVSCRHPTGGPDCIVRLWDTILPRAVLSGFVHIILQDAAAKLYSMDKSKVRLPTFFRACVELLMSCNCLRSFRFGTLARHTCCRRSRVLRLFSFWHATATSCSSFWWRRVKSRLSSRSSEMNIDLCKTHLTSVSLILHNKAISVSRDLQRFKHNYHLGCLERTQSQFNHTSAHTSGAWRATTRLHHCRLF